MTIDDEQCDRSKEKWERRHWLDTIILGLEYARRYTWAWYLGEDDRLGTKAKAEYLDLDAITIDDTARITVKSND